MASAILTPVRGDVSLWDPDFARRKMACLLQVTSHTDTFMWPSAGPSWLVENNPSLTSPEANTKQATNDYSPPTKWPRATTPVNARTTDSFLLGTSADSGVYLNLSFNSPPIVNKDQSRMSPGLRTPTSRPGIHLSTTPSPFRTFRLTSFNSPTFTDRALRLSNSENVVGFRFRGDSIEKPKRITEVNSPRFEATETSSVSRCLRMPPTNDDTNLDQTLPMTMGDFYDSKLDNMVLKFSADDSGLFCSDVDLKATSTPLRCSSQPYLHPIASIPPLHNPYAEFSKYQTDVPNPPSPVLIKSSPPTPSSFKRAMRDVQRQGTLQPRKLLTESTNVIATSQNVKAELQVVVGEALRRRRESTIATCFEPPKKPLKPYSRRWMRLATGGTQCQKDLTAAAHAFIARVPRYKDSW